MKLFEINEELENLIDFSTGEILDPEAFDKLQMARTEKLQNIALLYKNMTSDAKQLKELEKEYSDRRKRCEKTAEWCKETLTRELNGEKFEDEKKRFKISWRKSEKVEITDPDAVPHAYVKFEPNYNKTLIKDLLKDGYKIDGVKLVESQNIQIK
jgi:Neuraminidase (sialidase)